MLICDFMLFIQISSISFPYFHMCFPRHAPHAGVLVSGEMPCGASSVWRVAILVRFGTCI